MNFIQELLSKLQQKESDYEVEVSALRGMVVRGPAQLSSIDQYVRCMELKAEVC